jgi:RNA-directed DNA polymerase
MEWLALYRWLHLLSGITWIGLLYYFTGRAYLGTRLPKKSIRRVCRAISEETDRRGLVREVQDHVERLNRLGVGWANYFCLGPVSKA